MGLPILIVGGLKLWLRRKIARGVEAVRRVAAVFPTASPLIGQDQWGTPVRVEPGTIFGGDRMFITTFAGGVAFTVGDKLYSQGPGDFIRDTYLIALGEGARRAAWLIPIAGRDGLSDGVCRDAGRGSRNNRCRNCVHGKDCRVLFEQ